jgi:hypothetical protein
VESAGLGLARLGIEQADAVRLQVHIGQAQGQGLIDPQPGAVQERDQGAVADAGRCPAGAGGQ